MSGASGTVRDNLVAAAMNASKCGGKCATPGKQAPSHEAQENSVPSRSLASLLCGLARGSKSQPGQLQAAQAPTIPEKFVGNTTPGVLFAALEKIVGGRSLLSSRPEPLGFARDRPLGFARDRLRGVERRSYRQPVL